MRHEYAQASLGPALPEQIVGEGLLVGWSMEWEHKRQPMGFRFGDEVSQADPKLIDPILFDGEGHLITIAATGAGKGIGCIVPALLTHKGPMIVIDPKGENAAVTRRYREEVLGQQVHVIDPMDIVAGESAALNPLDAVDPADPNAVDEAAAISDILGQHNTRDDRNAYWHSRGRDLMTGMIMHAVSSPDRTQRTLSAIRDNLNQPIGPSANVVKEEDNGLYQLLKNSPHAEARRAADGIRSLADVTLGSIVSMAQDLVGFVRGEPVCRATSHSSFALDAVTRGDPMTIYIVLPPHMLESHAQLLRLWVGTLLKAIMKRNWRTETSTMLLLDEAAQLGEFAPLRTAITLLRGYGLQTWSFWQDVDQLKHAYPKAWRTLINNCRVVQAFGAPNMSAAASIAELFHLPDPGRILDLENDEMLVQIAGDDAFVARRPNYLTEPAFAGRFDPNPFYAAAPPPVPDRPPHKRADAYLRGPPPETDEDELIDDLLDRFG